MKIFILFLLSFLLFWHWFDPVVRKNELGIQYYNQKMWQEALNAFLEAKAIDRKRGEIYFNVAAVLYQQKKFVQSREELQKGIVYLPAQLKASAFYNIANCYFQENNFVQAAFWYRRALISDQQDIQAKINLELALQKMQKEQEPPEEKEQQYEMEKKHQPLMDYLNQNEKELQKKQQRPTQISQNEKDW